MTMIPISMNSDYTSSHGSPKPYIARIAEAGFPFIHWCHHWSGDFLYSDHEIDQIGAWLSEYGLQMKDCHASRGNEKQYDSLREYERLSGIELLENRIRFTQRLGGDVIVVHLHPPENILANHDLRQRYWKQVFSSLDVVCRFAGEKGVRLAFENLLLITSTLSYHTFEMLFDRYGIEEVGLCYDSGHGLVSDSDGLDLLETFQDRLSALHLHENNGIRDEHRSPFSTNQIDWPRLCRIIAASPYKGPVTLELNMAPPEKAADAPEEERNFLQNSREVSLRLVNMIEESF